MISPVFSIEVDKISLPFLISIGKDLPFKNEVSKSPSPEITTESTGIISASFARSISPFFIFLIEIFAKAPSSKTFVTVFGTISNNFLKFSSILSFERFSKNLPKLNKNIMAQASTKNPIKNAIKLARVIRKFSSINFLLEIEFIAFTKVSAPTARYIARKLITRKKFFPFCLNL